MRIVKLSAENIKRLKAVEISPNGAVVEVTGPNGSGKSSVLDAIYYALAGGEVIPSKVVRQGEEKAVVRLDLGELVVTRRFQANGNTSLVVEAGDGARYPSPQRMLDDLVGSLSFDPLEFVRMEPREQLDALRRVVKLDVDIDALDAGTKKLVENRTVVNRELRQLESQIAATPEMAMDGPTGKVDVMELMDKIETANKFNESLAKDRKFREDRATRIAEESLRVEAHRKDSLEVMMEAEEECKGIMEKARAASNLWNERAKELAEKVKIAKAELDGLEPLTAQKETGPLVQRVREAEGINRAVEQRKKFEELKARVAGKKAEVHVLTQGIDSNAKERAEAVARAEMPVEGLSFGEGEVVYGGLPLGNASSAEQLRVSVGVAMAANPKLRILRVKDGSLLDDNSLGLLASLVEAGGYQLWIERVEESDQRPCVVMEDGNVKAKAATAAEMDAEAQSGGFDGYGERTAEAAE